MADSEQLAPGLLLAAPNLRDPNFSKTVVLLGRHDEEGALGWVINGRALSSVTELFKESGLFPEGTVFPSDASFQRLASTGGPVAPATGWLLYRPNGEEMPGQLELNDELAITGEAGAFGELLALRTTELPFRVILGCAGWAPGQLEAEISEGAWLPAALDVDLVFDYEGDRAWDEAYRRAIGAAPAVFSGRPAKA
jgi:putative transcriptional regulator